MRAIVPVVLIPVLASCASTNSGLVPVTEEKAPPSPYAYTINWNPGRTLGAGLQPAAYEHVLGRSEQLQFPPPAPKPRVIVAEKTSEVSEPLLPKKPATTAAPSKVEKTDPLRLAYEKYCDGGVDMTEEDWALVEASEDIPADLRADCLPPK